MKKRIALLIGINDYGPDSGLSPLRFAEADVDIMSDILHTKGEFTIHTLKGPAATHDAIIRTLRRFYSEEDLGLFLLYFAGHGEMMFEIGKFCFHCFGSEAEDTIGALTLSEIAQRIRNKIPAPSAALIIDACRSRMYRSTSRRGSLKGFGHSVVSDLKSISDEVPRFWEQPPLDSPQDQYLVTLLSCGPGQFSYEDSELRHGIFTYGLVQELRGSQGAVPLGEIRKRVGDFTRARCRYNNLFPLQTPEWIEPSFSGELFLGAEPSEVSDPDSQRLVGTDRRSLRRYEMQLPVKARLAHGPENVIPTVTEDISAHGMRIISEYPASVGHDITMDVTMPSGISETQAQVCVRTKGKIVRVETATAKHRRTWKIAATIAAYKFLDAQPNS